MNTAELSPSARVRGLMRRAETANLASALARDDSGWPYGSLVLVALDHDASPLLLISELAEHTKNIGLDSRVALLFDGTGGWRDPLAGPRATVLGRAERTADARLRARFLARHPGAQAYIDFTDFHLYRVIVERAHLVAGFGAIHWLDAAETLVEGAATAPLATAEADIVSHMNQDHGAALDLMAGALLGLEGTGWRMAGIDPEGCDLRRDERIVRLDFEHPIGDAQGAREVLAALTAHARATAESES